MRWIDKARDVAKDYKANCRELEKIREHFEILSTASQSTAVRSSKIVKPVEAAVENKLMQERYRYLQQATEAVDFAMEEVLKKPQGDITIKLFNMVYYNRSHTLYGAANAVNIGEATAKRYNRFLLKMIALHMGFLNFPER